MANLYLTVAISPRCCRKRHRADRPCCLTSMPPTCPHGPHMPPSPSARPWAQHLVFAGRKGLFWPLLRSPSTWGALCLCVSTWWCPNCPRSVEGAQSHLFPPRGGIAPAGFPCRRKAALLQLCLCLGRQGGWGAVGPSAQCSPVQDCRPLAHQYGHLLQHLLHSETNATFLTPPIFLLPPLSPEVSELL